MLTSAASEDAARLLPCAADEWHHGDWLGGTQLQPDPGAGVGVEGELGAREQWPRQPTGSAGGPSPAPGQAPLPMHCGARRL